MNSPDSAPRGNPRARRPTDLAAVTDWWQGLGGDEFFVLPPPRRDRYTQSDGHEDAAELLAHRGSAAPASFAYWHWQSHERAFGSRGRLRGELLVHWGGDHTVVAAGLGDGPDGFRIVDGGPRGAFALDRVTHRDDAGLPEPADPDGVRQFLDALDEPVDRGARAFRYRPLSPAESEWLHERLCDPLDLSAVARFVVCLERREGLTRAETDLLLRVWRAEYAGRLAEWSAWRALLHALLRHDHHEVWEVTALLGPEASSVLGRRPSERSLAVVREFALAGDRGSLPPWLAMQRALDAADLARAAAVVAAELTAHDAPETALRTLYGALIEGVTDNWCRETGADHDAARTYARLAAVRFSTDERLPRALRVVAAQAARDHVGLVRDAANRPGVPALAGTDTAGMLSAVDRFESARDGLLTGTGPDLTAYEGALGDVWHRYRILTDDDVRWLRERVADPETGLQGLGFCLELLHAHGVAAYSEVEALLPRRLKDLTRPYRTTYTEWRHPLVTLTCLALDLGHPAAERLVAWWHRPRPVWKDELRLLTHLGAPDEAKAAELWDFATSRADDVGQLMTWVLLRARLDGEHPLLVADRLLGTPGLRDHVLHRVLLAVADPAQPLWHYAIDPRSRGWWQRAVEVADHPRLSPRARALGLRTAREHLLVRHPDQLSPSPTEAERETALAWIEHHAVAGTEVAVRRAGQM
ncbi:hypothetical protein [Streptomyces sp. NPDC003717]|uniref:hypothetical protein n=1 Tax=Streptomyces sp. NPDC003717 TaxID=3154276 RepID=UPI0033A802EF